MPLFFTGAWLSYEKRQVRKSVKRQVLAGIPDEQLVHLAFPLATYRQLLRWEDAAEFEFEGQMFDIVRTESTSDSIYFTCWADREETRINYLLTALVDGRLDRDANHRKAENLLFQFFQTLFCNPAERWDLWAETIERGPLSLFFLLVFVPK